MLEHSDRLVTCQPSIGIAEGIQFLEVGRILLRGHRRWRYPPQHLGYKPGWLASESIGLAAEVVDRVARRAQRFSEEFLWNDVEEI